MTEEHKIQVSQERTFSRGILSITTTYRLLVTGDCGLKELDRLIRLLLLQKQILDEAESEKSVENNMQLGTGSESATGLAQCNNPSPARQLSDGGESVALDTSEKASIDKYWAS